jgi:hypothetical protein
MADEPGKPVMIGTDVVGQMFASLADSDASRPRHARGDAAAA